MLMLMLLMLLVLLVLLGWRLLLLLRPFIDSFAVDIARLEHRD
jgi:hypothetical protein